MRRGGTYFRRTPATDLVQFAVREAVGGSGGGAGWPARPLDGGWVAAPIRRVGRVPPLKKSFVPFPWFKVQRERGRHMEEQGSRSETWQRQPGFSAQRETARERDK